MSTGVVNADRGSVSTEPAAARRRIDRSWILPTLVCGGAVVVLIVGLVAKWSGTRWGAPAQPLIAFWRPALSTWAIPGAIVLLASLYAAGRLLVSTRVRPLGFAAAAFGLTLVTRLALNVIHSGPGALQQPFVIGPNGGGEGHTEYLPALPFLDGGVGNFLRHFTEISPDLPVQAQGHPPGLLLTMHYLGIDTPGGLAALTIVVGALAGPLLYLLGRELATEAEARAAALLFVFVPTSLLYGATSADALFATLGVLAAVGLVARRPLAQGLGAAALALATFFSYAMLAVGAWSAIVRWRRDGLTDAIRMAALSAAVLLVAFVALDLVTGFNVIDVIRTTEDRYREGIASRRPYAFWLFGSPAAFILMLGPIAWFAARSLGRGEASAVALAAVLVISAVAGFTKAETERIYLFLVPFACLAAARALPTRRVPLVLVGATAQAVLVETFLFLKW